MSQTKFKPGAKTAIALLIIAVLVCSLFFSISVTTVPTSSDEALAVLMARAIAEGARPLLFWGTPYQFPLESYLMAPVAAWLPATPLGARIFPALLGIGMLLLYLLLLKRLYPEKTPFIAYVLICFPAAYVLTLQSAYFVPQYTLSGIWHALIPLLLIQYLRSGQVVSLFLLGVTAGLALSNHLLVMPLVVVLSMALLATRFIRSPVASLIYGGGLLIGLVPYLLSYATAKATATQVTGTHPLTVGIQRFFSPLIPDTLPVLLGVHVSTFPDLALWQGTVSWLALPVVICFGILLCLSTIHCLSRFVQQARERRWPDCRVQDVICGAVWLSLAAFALSTRSSSSEHRYLLAAAWYFPFLLANVLTTFPRLRLPVTVFGLLIVFVNFLHSGMLMNTWAKPGYISKTQDLPRLNAVRQYLKDQQITGCFASFWHVNRLTFESDGELVCSPPYNDRFFGWPLPYWQEVANQERIAYVLNKSHLTRFRTYEFERMLWYHGLTAQTKTIGSFTIYHDFTFLGFSDSTPVPSHRITQRIDGQSVSHSAVLDGNPATAWTGTGGGEVLELQLNEAIPLHRIRLLYPDTFSSTDTRFRIDVFNGEDWQLLREPFYLGRDRIQIRGSFPLFKRGKKQDFSFAPQLIQAIRLTPTTSSGTQPHAIADIELYEAVGLSEGKADESSDAESASQKDL